MDASREADRDAAVILPPAWPRGARTARGPELVGYALWLALVFLALRVAGSSSTPDVPIGWPVRALVLLLATIGWQTVAAAVVLAWQWWEAR